MATNKQMESKIYNLVSCLADNFGFDADAAFEFIRWETDVDHVGEILSMISKEMEKPTKKVVPSDNASEAPTESSAGGDVMEKIAACKKNIALWEGKLKEGKVKDVDKQREKIDKEKAKLAKLEAKAPKAPKAVEQKPAPATKKVEEKEKRIKRFSPVMASQLKTALEAAGLETSDKLKKEFQQFVEDLSDDDYRASGLADHMRAFAKLKAPEKPAPADLHEDEEDDESEDEKPRAPHPPPTSNVVGGGPDNIPISLKELQSIQMTAELGKPGVFWDADNGRFVKGPEADDDEDFVEKKFDGKDYVIGEKTGRVYEALESGDVFAGFVGVGKFKTLTMP